MRTSRIAWPLLGAILLAALHANAAPEPEAKAAGKDLPAEVDATPAIGPTNLAVNPLARVNDAANRFESYQHLKAMGIAIYSYADDASSALPANVADKAGKQLLNTTRPSRCPASARLTAASPLSRCATARSASAT